MTKLPLFFLAAIRLRLLNELNHSSYPMIPDDQIEAASRHDSEWTADLAALSRLYPEMDEGQLSRAKGSLDDYVALIVRTYRRKKIEGSHAAQSGL
jgi:hypothetical protein